MYRVVWRQRISSAESIPSNPAVHGGAGATFSAHAVDAAAAIRLGGATDLGHLLAMEATLAALRWLTRKHVRDGLHQAPEAPSVLRT